MLDHEIDRGFDNESFYSSSTYSQLYGFQSSSMKLLERRGVRVSQYLSWLLFPRNQKTLETKLLDPKKLLQMRGSDNWTLLHYAVFYKNINALKLILECEAAVGLINKRGIKGVTPLIIAAKQCSSAIISLLLEKDADISIQFSDTLCNVLHVACWAKNAEAIKIFSQYPDLLHSKDNKGETPIFYSADTASINIFRDLLSCRVSLATKNFEGWNIFHTLCSNKNLDGFKIAIDTLKKIDPKKQIYNWKNNEGCTPLHIAAAYCSLDFVTYFLELEGVNTNIISNNGRTILHVACYFNSPAVISYIANLNSSLLYCQDQGGRIPWDIICNRDFGDMNYVMRDYFQNFYHISCNQDNKLTDQAIQECSDRLCDAIQYNDIGGVLYFIRNKLEVVSSFKDSDNANIFHYAAYYSSMEVLELLLEQKCLRTLVQCCDKFLVYPIHFAAAHAQTPVLRLLLQYANAKNLDNNGCNALHYACMANNSLNAHHLLTLYPELIDSMDYYHNTPVLLSCTVQNDTTVMLQLLHSKKANFQVSNNAGNNPLHLACMAYNKHTVLFLCRNFQKLIQQQNNAGDYPLNCAYSSHNTEIVQILLAHGAERNEVIDISRN